MGLKSAIIRVITKLPAKYIVFESYPDYADNSKPVFDEMVRRGLNKKNNFVWICKDSAKRFPRIDNVFFVNRKSVLGKYCLMRTKLVICCNSFVHAFNPSAIHVFLSHGTAVKRTKDYYRVPDFVQYTVASSEGTVELVMHHHDIPRNRVVALGFPRNDVFSLPTLDLHKYIQSPFQKIIVWLPTFRQKKSGRKTGCEHALPIIWDKEKAAKLNDYCRQNGVLLIIKPHYAQDVSMINEMELSNIRIIYDSFFEKNGIDAYHFFSSCDALLTDYSSVYFDYTLCDKPIGLVWEDFEEYKSDPGFSINMDYPMKGGVKIYTLEDLVHFVYDIVTGKDSLREERREIRDKFNYSTDGKNAKRVTDFLINNTDVFVI